jgi:hypothetical protein
MSHFAVVLVIEDAMSTNPEQIQERIDREMAPFMENCCGEPDKMYMKFYDEEDEMLKKYEEESQEMVVMPDGRLLLPWDEEFKKNPNPEDPMSVFGPPKASEGLPKKRVPFKETFSTFEEYAKEWFGRPKRDETYNRYGYWQNPRAKWDWFEIGGRWSGFFQLKPGREGAMGSQYNLTGTLEKTNGGKADVCFKSAIDFDRMRNEVEEEAAKRYDLVQQAIKDLPVANSWAMVKAEFDFEKAPQDIEVARKVYHDQARVKAFGTMDKGDFAFNWMAGVEEYQIPREQYLRNARNHAAVPFAVLKDGKWYEEGEMGWFGMASNEKDPETWNSMVNKLMDDLSDDTLLVVIDCHI